MATYTYELETTVQFEDANGEMARYEIYYDDTNLEYHAEVYHLSDVSSVNGRTIKVWHKIPNTISRLSGSSKKGRVSSCKFHFEGK
ncbi:hypothetical protein [Rosenbergiella epipactidis]|uniref:hypothetical protein n=1 Tax=Rosenbergiella epipactidis TaxID=1544694 RepID=UPI001F4ECB6F|nr:hypothetical protein [Rosenbergiella epipactidis]